MAIGDTFQVSDPSGNLVASVKRDGLTFRFEMPDGSLIGEIHGSQTDQKLTEYDELYDFRILNAQGQLKASVKGLTLSAVPYNVCP